MKLILLTVLLILSSQIGTTQNEETWSQPENPIELGQIHWLRNYNEAIKEAEKDGLPILILFQEVPGCSNCTTYGHEVLSHPFIVEMIETHFTPLAIFNNRGGHDREVLRMFKEPTWNNPVVRIVNAKGMDLVTRLSSDFTARGLAKKIKLSLSLSGQTEPVYFSNWYKELEGNVNAAEAYLAMYCFWTGEKEIAQLDGVLSTEAGFMHGREVVKVVYNKNAADLGSIVDNAKKVQCADQVFAKNASNSSFIDKKAGTYRIDKEVKYYLSKSDYKSIPMTPMQAAKVNAAIGEKQDPKGLFSPRQLDLFEKEKKGQNFINREFTSSWYKAIDAFY